MFCLTKYVQNIITWAENQYKMINEIMSIFLSCSLFNIGCVFYPYSTSQFKLATVQGTCVAQ